MWFNRPGATIVQYYMPVFREERGVDLLRWRLRKNKGKKCGKNSYKLSNTYKTAWISRKKDL